MIYINDVEIIAESYKDGALKCQTDQIMAACYTDLTNVITWRYESDRELFLLQCIVAFAREQNINDLYLEMPYLPHARQDKRNKYLFTLKYFCEIINSLNFTGVEVLDPHSDVSTALLNRYTPSIKNKLWQKKVAEIAQTVDAVMYPDTGSAKRYHATDKDFIGFKHRNYDDKIDGFELMNFKDGIKSALIVDDICSTGMTFYEAAKLLKQRGVEHVCLAVSHCENTLYKEKVFDFIDKIYTTNSICSLNDPKIEVVKLFYPLDNKA